MTWPFYHDRKGGPLTVSDANLYLGRLLPDYFPKIFGPNENEPLDSAITVKKFEELAKQINASNKGSPKSVDEIVYGYIKVANETMCRPIRALTEAKGHDTSNHTLAVFGGAGGQHGEFRNVLRVVKQLVYSADLLCYSMRYCKKSWYPPNCHVSP